MTKSKKILQLNREIYFLQQHLKYLESKTLEGCEEVDIDVLRNTIDRKRKELNEMEV